MDLGQGLAVLSFVAMILSGSVAVVGLTVGITAMVRRRREERAGRQEPGKSSCSEIAGLIVGSAAVVAFFFFLADVLG